MVINMHGLRKIFTFMGVWFFVILSKSAYKPIDLWIIFTHGIHKNLYSINNDESTVKHNTVQKHMYKHTCRTYISNFNIWLSFANKSSKTCSFIFLGTNFYRGGINFYPYPSVCTCVHLSVHLYFLNLVYVL